MTTPLLAQVHARLEASGIPAALIGAAALAAHGVSRSTLDQDLLVTDPRALAPDTWKGLTAIVEIRRGDADDPLLGVVRITADDERDVDVVVGRHAWQAAIVEAAVPLSFSGATIPVASAADLVLLKLYAGGPQDLWDVEQLRAIGGTGLQQAVEARLLDLPASARAAWARLSGRK